jgi:hypothetical protein
VTWATFADRDSQNVITSHVLYKVTTDEAGKHKLKAGVVLHGNKEQAADGIRSDAASIHFSLIRMILTIAAMMNLSWPVWMQRKGIISSVESRKIFWCGRRQNVLQIDGQFGVY